MNTSFQRSTIVLHITTNASMSRPAGNNYGICIHKNNYSVQDKEYNYHGSLQERLREGI